MSPHPRTTASLLGLLLAELALTLAIPVSIADCPPGALPGKHFLLGLLASQPLLLAVWLTLAPGKLADRGFQVLNATGLLLLGHAAADLLTLEDPLHAFFPLTTWGGVLLLAAPLLAALGFLRLTIDLHLVSPHAQATPSPPAAGRRAWLVRVVVLFLLTGLAGRVAAYSLARGHKLVTPDHRYLELFPRAPLTLLLLALPAALAVPAVLHRGWRGAWMLAILPVLLLACFTADWNIPHPFNLTGGEGFAYALGALLGVAFPLGWLAHRGWYLERRPSRPALEPYPGFFRSRAPLLLLAIHPLAAALLFWPNWDLLFPEWGFLIYVFLPLVILQPALPALWAALAQPPLRVRLACTLVCQLGLGLAWCWYLQWLYDDPELNWALAFSYATLTLLLLVLFGLGQLARVKFRLRLLAPGQPAAGPATHRDSQFTVRDLLLATAGVALLLTLCRFTFPSLEYDQRSIGIGFVNTMVYFYLIFTALAGPMVLTLAASVLHRGHGRSWFVAALITLLVTSLLFALYIVFFFAGTNTSAAYNWAGNLLFFSLLVAGLQSIFALAWLAPLFLLRGLGWRIVRLPTAGVLEEAASPHPDSTDLSPSANSAHS